MMTHVRLRVGLDKRATSDWIVLAAVFDQLLQTNNLTRSEPSHRRPDVMPTSRWCEAWSGCSIADTHSPRRLCQWCTSGVQACVRDPFRALCSASPIGSSEPHTRLLLCWLTRVAPIGVVRWSSSLIQQCALQTSRSSSLPACPVTPLSRASEFAEIPKRARVTSLS